MSGSTTAAMLKFSLNHISLFGNVVNKKIKLVRYSARLTCVYCWFNPQRVIRNPFPLFAFACIELK